MHDKIKAFLDSLDLPSSQIQILTDKLEGDSTLAAFLDCKDYDATGLISLAGQSAEICLGANSVDTTALNQTTVDTNWSVDFSARICLKLTIMIKVSSMLEKTSMDSTPRIGTRCIQDAQACQLFPTEICCP